MLSIGAMGHGQAGYYLGLAREDYYLAGGEPPGVWQGRGARDLGLSGPVEAEALTRLLEGFHPRDGRALIQNAGAAEHQPGWDLTFSAPKSISVLWSQAEPETRAVIQAAHFAAVQAGLGYLEEEAAMTRRGKGGAVRENARLVVATFEHGTSRAQDPQIHTHSLFINVCTRADGTSGTVESKPLYQAKLTAGALYRAELAAQLEQRLHLSAERTGSCFEVEGVPAHLRTEFSKRRADIEAALHAHGYDSPEAAATATLATRHAKGHVSRENLFQDWQATGRSLGWGPADAATFLQNAAAPERAPLLEWEAALQDAQARGTAQQSFFSKRDFTRYVAEEAQGRGFGAATARALADRHLTDNPDIVPLGTHKGQPVYTTAEMMETERRLLAQVDSAKDHLGYGVTEQTLRGVLASRRKLNAEQQAALTHVCGESLGRIRLVSGMAGTGKTTLLDAARFAWELEGFEVSGAALSGKAAKGLADGARIPSETLHRTLWDLEKGTRRLHEHSVLVIDEAAMVGTRLMERLVALTARSGARLVLVGDAKQLQPIEAGGPFLEMERRLGAATLTGIVRQREEWARGAVSDFAAGRADEGLAAFAQRGLLTVAADRREACAALISSWKVAGVQAPEEQLIFAGTRLEAAILNQQAQEERAKAGMLGAESVAAPDGGGAFHVGDRLLFTKKSRVYGVENGSVGDVVAVNAAKNTLAARLDSGERVTVPLEAFPHVRLAYALTTHKGQGSTVERAFVLAGGSMQDREITYVQASRARGETQIFTDQDTAGPNLTGLVRQMRESRQKEMAHSISQKTGPQEAPLPGL